MSQANVRPAEAFLTRPVREFGKPVCRLGLASHGNTAITAEDVLHAVSRGVNFLNWSGFAEGPPDDEAFPAAVAALAGTATESRCACSSPPGLPRGRQGTPVGARRRPVGLCRRAHPLLRRAGGGVGRAPRPRAGWSSTCGPRRRTGPCGGSG